MAAVPASDNANDGWIIRRACPPDWPRLVGLCGGNFFHTPMGLLAGAPDGPPLYCEWWREGRVVGIASGVQSRCRLSLRPRHVYLPTMPALVPQADADEALTAVVRVLAARGAADVIVDSFAAPLAAPLIAPQPIVIRRSEYIVSFEDGRSELLGRFTNHHRRIVNRGTRAGWTLRLLRGPDASSILATVHDSAVRRHARRGSRYQARMPAAAPLATTDLTAFWGAAVFSAWDGEVLLTAALVGWANRRAYYISGGSSETGYRLSAAVWLHWQIMMSLNDAGCSEYNLGGSGPLVPASDDGNESGLRRFKADFGGREAPCASARWELRPSHTRLHRVTSWLVRLGNERRLRPRVRDDHA